MAETKLVGAVTKCSGGYIVIVNSELLSGKQPAQNIIQAAIDGAGGLRAEPVVCQTMDEVCALLRRIEPKTIEDVVYGGSTQ